MNKAVILLGSNTGNLSGNLAKALWLIAEHIGAITGYSHVYETEPWGNTGQPAFYNQVIEITTSLEAGELMKKLLNTEEQIGRKRVKKWEPRIIDLDILYFNDDVINEPGLIIPHPHLHERRFTLVPLSELFPETIHPVLKKKNKDLLAGLTDKLEVRRLDLELPSIG